MSEDYEFSAGETLILGELQETGWDWDISEIHPYTLTEEVWDAVKGRIKRRIDDEYYFREISDTPVARWEKQFLREVEKAVNSVGPLYQDLADSEGISLRDSGMEEEWSIVANSTFPQARLNTEARDYADNSAELQKQKVAPVNQIEGWERFSRISADIDAAIVRRLSSCFIGIYF